MFLTNHPQLAADVFRYDPAHPDAREAAAAIADEYVHHELARLCADDNASSNTALAALESLDRSAAVEVCTALEDLLLYFTCEWGPGWEATFAPGNLRSATRSGLIDPGQVTLCETWLARLQQEGVATYLGGHNPFLAQATTDDARVLLALNVLALRAMGEHAVKAHRGVHDIVTERIQTTERILAIYPLPGLPRLPFPDEETASYAAAVFEL